MNFSPASHKAIEIDLSQLGLPARISISVVPELPQSPPLPAIAHRTSHNQNRTHLDRSSIDDAARQLIQLGRFGVTEEVVCSVVLCDALKEVLPPKDVPQTRNVSEMMRRLGYSRVPGLVKWCGWPHTVWTRGDVADVREALNRTLAHAG